MRALDRLEDHGRRLQPCFLDPRDTRITWLDAPSPETYCTQIALAQSDSEHIFPAASRKFLQCGNEQVPKIPPGRLVHFAKTLDDELDNARSKKKIENDYSPYEPLDHEKRESRIALLLQGSEDAPVKLAIVRMAYPWTQRNFLSLSYNGVL